MSEPFDVQPYIDAAARKGIIVQVSYSGMPATYFCPWRSVLFTVDGCDERFGITASGWGDNAIPIDPERWAEITAVEVAKYRRQESLNERLRTEQRMERL